MKVVAAMSGGVDSAVAAARAAEAGHDVTGIHLALSRNPASYRSGARGCCTIEDANDARRAADVIGIPFYVWDLSERFHEDVVEDFMDEYAAGRTPNPCLRCNEKIKFAAVLDRALGARLRRRRDRPLRPAAHRRRRADRDAPRGRPRQGPVLRARRARPRSSCAHSLFPLGDTPKAGRARARPAARGLLVADKPDSHDICFVADGDNAGWLREKLGDRAPNHGGDDRRRRPPARCSAATTAPTAFTIGQRKGLRLGRPAPDGKPRFVLDIEPVSGTVTVGPARARSRSTGSTGDPAALVRHRPDRPLEGTVQLRAHGDEHRAVVTVVDGDGVEHRAARPGVRHRARPGRRDLRRHPGRRLGHDRVHAPAPSVARVTRRHRRRLAGPATTPRRTPRRCGSSLGELPDLPHLPELPGRGRHRRR